MTTSARKSNAEAGFAPFGSTPQRKRSRRPVPDETLLMFDMPLRVWCPYAMPRPRTPSSGPDGHLVSVENFGKNASRKSGLQTYCKACRKLRSARDRKRSNRKNLVREMRYARKRIEKLLTRTIDAFERLHAARQDISE